MILGVLEREIATDNITPIGGGHFENISKYAWNGSSVGNTTPPQWSMGLYEIFDFYLQAHPYSWVLIWAVPFILLYIGSGGSAKMAGIVGIIVSLLGFLFLPASIQAFAILTIALSAAATVWGIYHD